VALTPKGPRLNRLGSLGGTLGQVAGVLTAVPAVVWLYRQMTTPVSWGGAAAVTLALPFVVVAAIIVFLWRRHRRRMPAPATIDPGEVRLTPPDDVTPSMAAWLIGGDSKQVMLALVADLVVRKVIKVASPEKGVWALHWAPHAGGALLTHESLFLKRSFGREKGLLTLPRQRKRLQGAMRESDMVQDMVGSGLASRAASMTWRNFAVGFVAAFLFIGGIGAAPYGIGIVLVIVMTWFYVVEYHAPIYEPSAAGRQGAEEVLAFGRYLDTAEVGQLQWELNNSIVAGYVPWALALGRMKLWSGWQRHHRETEPGQEGDMARLFSYLFSLVQPEEQQLM